MRALVCLCSVLMIGLSLFTLPAGATENTNPGGWPYEQQGDAKYPYTWEKSGDSGDDFLLNHKRVSPACKWTRYTTTGDKSVKPSAGTLCAIIAWAGTSVTATLYDNAGATCNTGGTQLSPSVALTNGQRVELQVELNNGLCVTIGGTSPDVLVFWR